MEDEPETNVTPPMVAASPDKPFARLRQVTVKADDEVEQVNQLLADGWRLVSVGYRADATVYVLGQLEDKRKQRAGFGFMRAAD